MRRQPRIAGVRRRPMNTSALPALERAIEREMARYDCSRAFVLSTLAAFGLGIDEYADYRQENGHRRRRRGKK